MQAMVIHYLPARRLLSAVPLGEMCAMELDQFESAFIAAIRRGGDIRGLWEGFARFATVEIEGTYRDVNLRYEATPSAEAEGELGFSVYRVVSVMNDEPWIFGFGGYAAVPTSDKRALRARI